MNSGSDDDLGLLERIRRGDTDGAAELFERYAPALLRFTDRMLSDRASAEEVTQEVFVKVISRAHQYDGRAGVASWLFAIAANACRDRRRRERRASIVPLEAVAEPRARGEGIEASLIASRERRARRPRGPVRALRGAARGPRPRPLSRDALRRDRRDARHLGGRRQDPHLPGRRSPEGPLFRGRTLMDCRDVTQLAVERLDRRGLPRPRAASSPRTWRPASTAAREMAASRTSGRRWARSRRGGHARSSGARRSALLEEEMIRGRVRAFRPRPAFAQPAAPGRGAPARGRRRLRRGARDSGPPRRRLRRVFPVAAVDAGRAAHGRGARPRRQPAALQRLVQARRRPGARRHRLRRHDAPRRSRASPSDPDVAKLLAYLVAHNARDRGREVARDRARVRALRRRVDARVSRDRGRADGDAPHATRTPACARRRPTRSRPSR